MMVKQQPEDGHPPEGSILQIRNLALRPYLQIKDQVTSARNGHLDHPQDGLLPTQPNDGHQPEGPGICH